MTSKTITFGDPKSKTKFLSITSYHPVIIEGKRYPTAYHYILSQKYFDDEVRMQPTIFLANKNIKYSKSRHDWKEIQEETYYKVLVAKFTQNPSLKTQLINTHPLKLSSRSDPITAKVLMIVRDDFVTRSKNPKRKLFHTPIDKDFIVGILTNNQKVFVTQILDLCKRITKKEGCESIYGGILEDAFVLLFPKLKEFYEHIQTEDIQIVPNTFKIRDQILSNIFSSYKVHKKERLSIATTFSLLLRWIKFTATTKQQKYITKHASLASTIEVVLLPGHRPYRTTALPVLPAKTATITQQPAVANFTKSLELVETENELTVQGKNIPKFSSKLLELGGRYTSDETAFTFDLSKKSELEEFIEQNLDEEEIKQKKISQQQFEFLSFLEDVFEKGRIEKTYLNVNVIVNLISKESSGVFAIERPVLDVLKELNFDESSVSLVKKRLKHLSFQTIPSDEDFAKKGHEYLFSKLSEINSDITKDDVWKVFTREGKTLSSKEDVRRAACVYNNIKLPPIVAPPTPSPPKRRVRKANIKPTHPNPLENPSQTTQATPDEEPKSN